MSEHDGILNKGSTIYFSQFTDSGGVQSIDVMI